LITFHHSLVLVTFLGHFAHRVTHTKATTEKPLDVLQKVYISHIVNYSAGDTLFTTPIAGVSRINITYGELGDHIDEYRDE
jgi:hypothetical protein